MNGEAVEAIGVQCIQRAHAASGAIAAAGRREKAARDVVRRSQAERNFSKLEEAFATAKFDAARQWTYLKSDRTLATHASNAAFVRYMKEKFQLEAGMKDVKVLAANTYGQKVDQFYVLAYAHGPLEHNGVTIAREAFDREKWTDLYNNSKYAALSTLEYVLAEGLVERLLQKLQPGASPSERSSTKLQGKLRGSLRRTPVRSGSRKRSASWSTSSKRARRTSRSARRRSTRARGSSWRARTSSRRPKPSSARARRR